MKIEGKLRERLERQAQDRDAPLDAGDFRPLGDNVLLRLVTPAELSETQSKLLEGLDGKRMARVKNDEVAGLVVVATGPGVKGDILEGDLAYVYPAVATRLTSKYLACPESAIFGVTRTQS